MALRLIAPPAAEPIGLADARAHLNLLASDTSHDSWITARIPGIRGAAEAQTRRGLITQRWRMTLDAFPGCEGIIEVPLPPLQRVNAVEYTDAAGVAQALVEGVDYQVDADSEPARVYPAVGRVWPITQCDTLGAVQITFTCGYGDAAADVPAGVKSWMLCQLTEMFEHRGDAFEGRPLTLPSYVDGLLDPCRWTGL